MKMKSSEFAPFFTKEELGDDIKLEDMDAWLCKYYEDIKKFIEEQRFMEMMM